MAGQIQLFRSLHGFYREIGINLRQSNEKWSLNWRNLFVLFFLLAMTIAIVAFLLFNAKSVIEFGLGFYGCVTTICCTMNLLLLLWQSTDISKLIESSSEFIGKSKYKKTQSSAMKITFFTFLLY